MLGGLSQGSFAPLLAEAVFMDGFARRVVLHRPAPPGTWPLASVSSRHVVAEESRLVCAEGTFAVSPYVEGHDADEIVTRGISERAVLQLLEGALAGLAAAAAVGVGHGALSGANIRVDRSGTVRLIGFRGAGKDDVAELFDLVDTWLDAPSAALQELLANPPPDPVEALARVRQLDLLGPGLTDLPPPEPRLFEHALSGITLKEAPPAPPVPAKVRVAGTAAVTLLLGFLAGWFLGRGP